MAGCIAIGSHVAAKPLVSFLILHEPMNVQLHCVIWNKASVEEENWVFTIQRLQRSTSEISKGNWFSVNLYFRLHRVEIVMHNKLFKF